VWRVCVVPEKWSTIAAILVNIITRTLDPCSTLGAPLFPVDSKVSSVADTRMTGIVSLLLLWVEVAAVGATPAGAQLQQLLCPLAS
jgi:hypothetical protein